MNDNLFMKFFMIKNKLHHLKKKIIWYYQKFTFNPHFFWEKNGGEKYFNSFHTSKNRNENQFLDFISIYKPKRIIDIGCGYGRYLKSIRNEFPNIELYGSDISSTQIEYAKKYLSSDNVNLFVSDSTKFNFQDNFFDLSIGYSIWEHIPPKNFEIIFNEICRISKRGYFLEFDRTAKNKYAKINSSHYIFSYDLDSKFKNNLISKKLIKGSWGEYLFHLDFKKHNN